MKKYTLIFTLIFLFGSCIVVDKAPKKQQTNRNSVNTSATDKRSEDNGANLVQERYDTISIILETSKSDAIYERGEKILFRGEIISNKEPIEGDVKYVISNDGAKQLKTDVAKVNNRKFNIPWKGSEPMIIRCEISYKTKLNGNIKAMAAAAIAPYEIKSTAIEPTDFMNYWSQQKSILENIPMNAQLDLIDESNGVKNYDLTIDNANGSKVYAYFSIPTGKGPFPALLLIPGAGVKKRNYSRIRHYAAKGIMTIQVGIHDVPNNMSDSFYNDKKNGDLKNYYFYRRENRDTYYFHRVVLECMRAIDFLTSRSDWDKKHMVVSGSSQGGGLTLITAGLDKRITAASVNVPALSDHSGRNFGRPSGWPQLVPIGEDGILDPKILEVAEYYDATNFAKYVDVPVVFGVGLIDNTCSPTTVFSAYNRIQSEKQIDISPLMKHSFSPSFRKLSENFILEQTIK